MQQGLVSLSLDGEDKFLKWDRRLGPILTAGHLQRFLRCLLDIMENASRVIVEGTAVSGPQLAQLAGGRGGSRQ